MVLVARLMHRHLVPGNVALLFVKQQGYVLMQRPLVNGTERCPVFGKIRCPIFCTLKDSNPGGYPEAALPSSSFTATLSIPALRLVLSR